MLFVLFEELVVLLELLVVLFKKLVVILNKLLMLHTGVLQKFVMISLLLSKELVEVCSLLSEIF